MAAIGLPPSRLHPLRAQSALCTVLTWQRMRRRREQRMRQQQVQRPELQQKPVQQALLPEQERERGRLQEPRQVPERAQELLPSCRKRRGRRQRSR